MAGVCCWKCGAANEDTAVCDHCGASVAAPGRASAPDGGATTAPLPGTATGVAPPRTAPAVAAATYPQAWPVISPEPVGDAIVLARLEDEAHAAAYPVVRPRPLKSRRVGLAVVITAIAMAVAGVMALTAGLMVRGGDVGGGGAYPGNTGFVYPGTIEAAFPVPGGTLGIAMPDTWFQEYNTSCIMFSRSGDYSGSLTVTATPSGNASLESFAQAAVRQEESRIGPVVFGAPVATTVMGLPALEFSADDRGILVFRLIVVADAANQWMYTILSMADPRDGTLPAEIQAGIDSLYKV